MSGPQWHAGDTRYHEALLEEDAASRAKSKTTLFRWKLAAAVGGVAALALSAAVLGLAQERAALKAELLAKQPSSPVASWAKQASRPSLVAASTAVNLAAEVDTCTLAGLDVFDNNAGAALPCCANLVQVNTPCRGGQVCQFCVPLAATSDACTPAGTDVFDNNVHRALKCCPGLVEVDTPCRGSDLCQYCQPKGMGQIDCTPPGKDIFANPTGEKQPCCKGLVETTAPCRGDDVCQFCIPSSVEDGPRAEYPPAKISIDPATPKSAVDKHKKDGMSLILSVRSPPTRAPRPCTPYAWHASW